MKKGEFIAALAEYLDEDVSPKIQVANFLEGLSKVMRKELRKNGEFTLPGPKSGMLKVIVKKIPAVKKGTLVRNPATGKMVKSQGKPARKTIRVRPLTGTKNLVA